MDKKKNGINRDELSPVETKITSIISIKDIDVEKSRYLFYIFVKNIELSIKT